MIVCAQAYVSASTCVLGTWEFTQQAMCVIWWFWGVLSGTRARASLYGTLLCVYIPRSFFV